MRKISTILVTAAGIAAMSLATAGVSSASENSAPSDAPTATSRGVVTSTTTTHAAPYLAADKTGTLYKGSPVEVRCWVPGQVVDGKEIWFMLGGGLGFAPRAAIQPDSTVPSCL